MVFTSMQLGDDQKLQYRRKNCTKLKKQLVANRNTIRQNVEPNNHPEKHQKCAPGEKLVKCAIETFAIFYKNASYNWAYFVEVFTV